MAVDAGNVEVRLGALFEQEGFNRYDRAIEAARREKNVQTQLKGEFHRQDFDQYEKALTEAQGRAKRRDAYKAALGGDFNPKAFNAMERELAKARREAHRGATANLRGDVDRRQFSLFDRLVGKARRERNVSVQMKAAVDNRSFRDAERASGKFHDHVKGQLKDLRGVALGVGGALLGAFTIRGIEESVKEVGALGKATNSLMVVTGMDATTASSWIQIAKQRGIQSKQLNQSFVALSRNIRNAEGGTKKSADAFKELGIPLSDLRKLKPEEVINRVTDGLSKMKNPAERAALAQQLFSRSGVRLLPLLAGGSKAIEEQRRHVISYGAALDKHGVKKALEAVRAQRSWNDAVEGVRITLGTALAPVLTRVTNRAANFIREMRQGKGQGGDFARTMKQIWQEAKPVVLWFGNAAKNVAHFAAQHPAIVKVATAILLAGTAVNKFRTLGAVKQIGSLLGALRRLAKTKAGEEAASEIAGGLGGASKKSAGPLSRFRSWLRGRLGSAGRSAGAHGGEQLAMDLAGGSVGGTKKREGRIRSGLRAIFKRLGAAMGLRAAETAADEIAGTGAASGVAERVGGSGKLKGGFRRVGTTFGRSMGGMFVLGFQAVALAGIAAVAAKGIANAIGAAKNAIERHGGRGGAPGPGGGGGSPSPRPNFIDTPAGKKWDRDMAAWLRKHGGAEGGAVTPGGIVRGYATGGVSGLDPRDTVPAMLSPGEGILTPKATTMIGGASGVGALNLLGKSTVTGPAGLLVSIATGIAGKSLTGTTGTGTAVGPGAAKAPLALAKPMDDERKRLEPVLAKVRSAFGLVPVDAKKRSTQTAKGVHDELDKGRRDWAKIINRHHDDTDDRFDDLRKQTVKRSKRMRDDVGDHYDAMRKDTGRSVGRLASTTRERFDAARDSGTKIARDLRSKVNTHYDRMQGDVRGSMVAVATRTRNSFDDARDSGTRIAKDLRSKVNTHYDHMQSDVRGSMVAVATRTTHSMQTAKAGADKGAKGVRSVVARSYESMERAVATGIGFVQTATSNALKGLGDNKPVHLSVPKPKNLARGRPGRAAGGRGSFMVDAPSRQDSALYMLGRDEAVVNVHHQREMDDYLGMFGKSVNQIIRGNSRPNYAATGKPGDTGGGGGAGNTHWDRLIAAANKVSRMNFPYRRGGGHEQPARFEPFDCSGAVSYITQHAGYRVPTTVSGAMGSWPFPRGQGTATIFYNGGHTFMRIGNRYWGTSGFARPRGGAGWFNRTPGPGYLAGFRAIHLPNLGADAGSGFGDMPAIRVKGSGPLASIAQRAIDRVRGAGSRKLDAAMAAMSPGMGQLGEPQGPLAPGEYRATSYGPPWGGIQGGGTTATGVNLHGNPHIFGVAVDPRLIPLGSRLKIWPNPFGTHDTFRAFDTGGAIKGRRIDFYDWRGRGAQRGWGMRGVHVTRATRGKPGLRYDPKKHLEHYGRRTFTLGQLGLKQSKHLTARQVNARARELIGLGILPDVEPPESVKLHTQLGAAQDRLTIADADLSTTDDNSLAAAKRLADVNRARLAYWRKRVQHWANAMKKRLSPYAKTIVSDHYRRALTQLGEVTDQATSAQSDYQQRHDDRFPAPDTSGATTDTAPTALQIADAAAQQLTSFRTEQATLFGSFGNNFASSGSNPFASQLGLDAGSRYFGAGASTGSGAAFASSMRDPLAMPHVGKVEQHITNVFQGGGGQAEAHAFTMGALHDLKSAV